MCGIVCYKGKSDAREVIVDGLDKLEYRGYDSAGLAVLNEGVLSIGHTSIKSIMRMTEKMLPTLVSTTISSTKNSN